MDAAGLRAEEGRGNSSYSHVVWYRLGYHDTLSAVSVFHPSTTSLDYVDILSRSVTAQSNAGALNSVAVTRH